MRINELFDGENLDDIAPGERINRYLGRDRAEAIIAYIKENCQEFMKILDQVPGFMYHGAYSASSDYFIGNPHVDRRVQLTRPEFQVAIDNNLKKAGFTALRSNSIFCTGSKNKARGFGKVYKIFPLDGFSYTWSPKLYDMTTDLLLSDYTYKKYQAKELSHSMVEKITSFINDIDNLNPAEFVNKYGFKDTDLVRAVFGQQEIYIHGKYLAVDDEVFLPNFK